MSQRTQPEFVVVAAWLVAVAALVSAVWIVIVGADAYDAVEARTDAFRGTAVASRLSSTARVRPSVDDAGTAPPRDAALRPASRERAEVRAAFATAKARAAFFGMLAVVALAFATAAMRRLHGQRKELEARMQAAQTHDPLTGLPNRRFFAEWLAFAIAHAGRTRAHVGVLFIDIGGCAAVVEHHGAPAVEALLVEIARRFRGASRGGDVFARLGPAQFALATPNAEHLRELSAIAQRLRDVLDDPAQPPLADSPIGTSIGMAFYPEDAGDSAGIIAAANAAMYAARRAGRNHVAFNALAA